MMDSEREAEAADSGTHASEEEIGAASDRIERLRKALNSVLFDQEELIDLVLTGILAKGHILLEGLPGLGKTELVKGLSQCLHLPFSRVQFTPDLLPGDITGNPMLEERDGQREFVFHPGPLFASLVLADEINRASPKTQSALLEAMQEGRVTVLGEGHDLPEPFFVLATQNPVDLEGTYPLPEAQLDRFLFKIQVTRNEVATLERIIAGRSAGQKPEVSVVMDGAELAELIALARRIYMPPVVANYIARVVDATHHGRSASAEGVRFGASPRAAIALAAATRARALLRGRRNASFEDVRALAAPVLCHRIILDFSARATGKTTADVVTAILEEVPEQDLATPSVLAEK